MKYSPRTFKNVRMSSFLHFLLYVAIISGVTRGLSLAKKFDKRGPLATVRGPLPNIQKKISEMMLNPGVDGYTKTLNYRKIIRKTQNNNLMKTKTIQKLKYKLAFQGGRPSLLRQLRHWLWYIEFTCCKLSLLLNCNNTRAGGVA